MWPQDPCWLMISSSVRHCYTIQYKSIIPIHELGNSKSVSSFRVATVSETASTEVAVMVDIVVNRRFSNQYWGYQTNCTCVLMKPFPLLAIKLGKLHTQQSMIFFLVRSCATSAQSCIRWRTCNQTHAFLPETCKSQTRVQTLAVQGRTKRPFLSLYSLHCHCAGM